MNKNNIINQVVQFLDSDNSKKDISEYLNDQLSFIEREKDYIGKKDINGNKIYASSSIFEFKHRYVQGGYPKECNLKGVFAYDNEKLCYKIELFENDIYKCLFLQYNDHIKDIKIIDNIQENKLGLIK